MGWGGGARGGVNACSGEEGGFQYFSRNLSLYLTHTHNTHTHNTTHTHTPHPRPPHVDTFAAKSWASGTASRSRLNRTTSNRSPWPSTSLPPCARSRAARTTGCASRTMRTCTRGGMGICSSSGTAGMGRAAVTTCTFFFFNRELNFANEWEWERHSCMTRDSHYGCMDEMRVCCSCNDRINNKLAWCQWLQQMHGIVYTPPCTSLARSRLSFTLSDTVLFSLLLPPSSSSSFFILFFCSFSSSSSSSFFLLFFLLPPLPSSSKVHAAAGPEKESAA